MLINFPSWKLGLVSYSFKKVSYSLQIEPHFILFLMNEVGTTHFV